MTDYTLKDMVRLLNPDVPEDFKLIAQKYKQATGHRITILTNRNRLLMRGTGDIRLFNNGADTSCGIQTFKIIKLTTEYYDDYSTDGYQKLLLTNEDGNAFSVFEWLVERVNYERRPDV